MSTSTKQTGGQICLCYDLVNDPWVCTGNFAFFFFLLMSFTCSESHLSFQKHSSITKCVSAHYILDSKQLFPHFSRFPCVLGTDLLHIPHQIHVPELNKQTRRREKEALGKTGLDHLLSGVCKANVNFYSSRYCTLDHSTLGWELGHNF